MQNRKIFLLPSNPKPTQTPTITCTENFSNFFMPFLTHFSTPITGNSSVGSMSIRAQGSILCPSSSSQIQSIQSPKPPCVLTVPTYFSFKIFSTKRGWLKSNSSFSSHCILPASTNLRRRNCVIKTEHKVVSDVEEDNVKSKAKRKNLAVFVSGGGSNFRSIFYATLNGSVHGDIVVLVTNKYGTLIILPCDFSFFWLLMGIVKRTTLLKFLLLFLSVWINLFT